MWNRSFDRPKTRKKSTATIFTMMMIMTMKKKTNEKYDHFLFPLSEQKIYQITEQQIKKRVKQTKTESMRNQFNEFSSNNRSAKKKEVYIFIYKTNFNHDNDYKRCSALHYCNSNSNSISTSLLFLFQRMVKISNSMQQTHIEMQHACRLWLLKVNNSHDHEHSLLWQFYSASLNLPAAFDVFVAVDRCCCCYCGCWCFRHRRRRTHLVFKSFRHEHVTLLAVVFFLIHFRRLVVYLAFSQVKFVWCTLLSSYLFTCNELVRPPIIIDCHVDVTTLQAHSEKWWFLVQNLVWSSNYSTAIHIIHSHPLIHIHSSIAHWLAKGAQVHCPFDIYCFAMDLIYMLADCIK